ncbi:hypothetical protein BRD01_07175 [Halobacteriales archaeon QS_8_65_32]|nr:MAG: hypothetical protein BRD01_07175 [Halobacteriales archaeon QS_8_65_32]
MVRKTLEAFFVHHERAELSRTTTDSEVGGADLPLGPATAFSRASVVVRKALRAFRDDERRGASLEPRASESREELCSDRVHESFALVSQ